MFLTKRGVFNGALHSRALSHRLRAQNTMKWLSFLCIRCSTLCRDCLPRQRMFFQRSKANLIPPGSWPRSRAIDRLPASSLWFSL